MPASIVIPPNFWSKAVTVIFTLTDQHRRPFPAEITDASGWVAGAQAFSIGADGATINIPCNDELPSPPGEDPPVGSFWLVSVDDNTHRPIYHVQISSASPPTNWNELIEASTPVDPADIWSGRLGPADAVAGQYQQFDGLSWQAVDPPAGTGNVTAPPGGATIGNIAIFNNLSGTELADGGPPGSGGIPEAPTDGEIYGRKLSNWSQITPAEIAAVPTTRRVDGIQSIVDGGDLSEDRSLRLSGDVATPGADKLYGTDGAGVRGWYDQPAGGGGVPEAPIDGGYYARRNAAWTTWAPSDVGAVPETRTVNGIQSILGGGALTGNLSFTFVNDSASPGANKLYGTDGTGTKGWFDQPTGGAGQTNLGNIPSATNVQITSSSGTDTTVVAATVTLAGVMSAAQVTQLNATATQANLDTHTTDTGNPHSVTKAQVGLGNADNTSDLAKPISTATQTALDGKENAGAAATVQSNLDTHTADLTNPHVVTKTQVGLGNADNTSDLDKPISTATQTALDAKIGAVIEDTTPELGGDLIAGGANNRIISITDLTATQRGILGFSTLFDGVGIGYKTSANPYEPEDGGLVAKAGQLILGGTTLTFDQLQHSQAEGYRDLVIAQNGNVFAMEPPVPGWSASDTSDFQHNFGNGKTQGPWVLVTNLSLMPTQDIAVGDRVDVQINLSVENVEDKTGTLTVGIGIDGAEPTDVGVSNKISGDTNTTVPIAITTTTHGGITTSQTINVFARRGASTDDAHLYLRGNIADHELFVTVPGETGGGGWTNGTTIGYWNLTRQDLGNVTGTANVDLDNGAVITATMTGVTTFTFSSSAGMTNMPFWLLLNTGGFSPTFAYTGKTVHDPADVSWSGSTANIYSVAFMMIGNDVDYSQNWRP